VATSSAFVGVLLAAATWPGTAAGLAPQSGLDSSWQAALAMGQHHGLRFGTQIVWTYGPLGFLTTGQLYYPATATFALVFKFGLAIATFAVLVSALRRYTTLVVASVIAYVAGYPMVAMWGGVEVVLALAFVLCVRLLSRPDDAWRTRCAWVCFGAIAALMTLEKLSLGVGVCVLASIAVACAPVRPRRVAAGLTLMSFAIVFVVGWFGTGNALSNLFAYVRGAREAPSGYSAMAMNPSIQPHDIVLAVIVGFAIVVTAGIYALRLLRGTVEPNVESVPPRCPDGGGAAATESMRSDVDDHEVSVGPSITRWTASGIVGASSLVTWMLFKEGFVRQDGHRLVFFASISLILSAFAVGPRSVEADRDLDPSRPLQMSSAIFVAALMVSSVVTFAVVGLVPAGFLDPGVSLGGFAGTLRTLASSTRRHDLIVEARTTLQRQYDVPAAMIAHTEGQTVDVDPIEQTVAWAYPGMRWDPLPTIQDYFAYTSALDRLDVDYIASPRAPRFILRQIPSSIDARLPVFDAPSTQVAIECNYRQVEISAEWQLVERGSNRCGAMQKVGRMRVAFGQPVTVPTPGRGDMIVATFDLHLPLWWRLLDTVYKPPQIAIDIDGSAQVNRFVERTASDLHVLAPASTLGYGASFSPLPIHSLTLISGAAGRSKYDVTITFYNVPVR
jgi:hypothetical protein